MCFSISSYVHTQRKHHKKWSVQRTEKKLIEYIPNNYEKFNAKEFINTIIKGVENPDITNKEYLLDWYQLLCEKYANLTPGRENEILWTKFADDIDIVFVVKHLEQRNDINEVLDITKKDFKLNELSLPDQATLQ